MINKYDLLYKCYIMSCRCLSEYSKCIECCDLKDKKMFQDLSIEAAKQMKKIRSEMNC